MAGLDHQPNVRADSSGDDISTRGTRYGRALFVIYLLLYGGYVGITAFAPEIMKRTPLAGINLSVLYGLGLIVAAFAMAVVYDWLCRPATDRSTDSHLTSALTGDRR